MLRASCWHRQCTVGKCKGYWGTIGMCSLSFHWISFICHLFCGLLEQAHTQTSLNSLRKLLRIKIKHQSGNSQYNYYFQGALSTGADQHALQPIRAPNVMSLSGSVLGPFRSRRNMAAWSQTISHYS